MSARRERLSAVRISVVATPAAEAVLSTGLVGMVQLREKPLDDAAYLERAAVVRQLCQRHGALFIVNDRVHLVPTASADGVHVGLDDLPVEEARARLGPKLLVGLSTHRDLLKYRLSTQTNGSTQGQWSKCQHRPIHDHPVGNRTSRGYTPDQVKSTFNSDHQQ